MRYVFGFLMALAVLTFAACDECVEPLDVAGEWEMASTVVSDDCGERDSQTFPMTITQDGNALTVATPELTFSGTICGNQIQMNGSFDEGDGTVTVDAALLVSPEEDSMQGSDTWTWTDGESCSGSDSLSATRVDDHCVEPVDVAGEWLMTATPIEDTCDGDLTPYTFGVTIVQEGNALAGQTLGATFPGTICGNQIQMSGSFSEYGETTTVDLQLTVSADGNSLEGSDSWNWTDGVESCGGSESLRGTRIEGWTCPADYYGTADGCDCGCGALDPDCIDGTVASCEYCGEPGSCSPDFLGCPGNIDPTQNWLCEGGTAVCGDDIVQWPEECDGVDLRGLDCTDLGFTGGTLACTANCMFDASGCTGEPVCGDDIVQWPEVCDGTDLGELTDMTCAQLGFTGGTLACNTACDNFDLTGCTGGPPGWTCPDFYDAADGCDCGCGVLDPDCAGDTVASCDFCSEHGSCSPLGSGCPGDIDTSQNWLCGG